VEGLNVKNVVGILGWLGIALVAGALVGQCVPGVPVTLQENARSLALAGLVVTLLYALTQWRDIRRSFEGRGMQYGSIAIGSVVVFLAVLAGINYIGNRQSKRWDWTAAGQFSMSDQTKQLLRSLSRPVKMRVFYGTGQDAQQYRDQLTEYKSYSGQLETEFVEVNRNPVEAEKHGVTSVPTVLIEYQGRTERSSTVDEQGITNALKKAVEGKAKKIYFVQGHGERDSALGDQNGYRGAAEALAQDNFEVAKVNLAQEAKIPDDATILAIAGPTIDYFGPEVEAVRTFLKRGGKLLLMIDPPKKDATTQPTSLIALAREWGVALGNDMVLDPAARLSGMSEIVPVGAPQEHPITRGFGNIGTAYPMARSATPIPGGADGKFAQKVVESSPYSWAETDIKGLYATGKPTKDAAADTAGPVTLVAAASAPAPEAPPGASPDAPTPETRVIVVGDSDFASNNALAIGGNKDMFLNMANWLAQQENLISIRAKDPADRRIQLSAREAQFLGWLALVIIPGLLFGTAFRVWWKRR
jgi:ABC-type uncharacterized transport system involved in gliding motility auxiliary subunit